MRTIIFTGPTLATAEVPVELDAVCLPPAAQADVYRAALERPTAIGIIDGYFESVPSIWHKEILWAMSQGIHVFGSASMGALRAAELEIFGMIGIGAIFEAYRNGILEDDDEVAVAHASHEHAFRASSDAMVNIRATVARAQAAGVLGESSAQALVAIAKALFYPERSYARVLELGAEQGLASGELEAFRCWLPAGRVDQKRKDALAMLQAMREFLASAPEPKSVSYYFEETHHWEVLIRNAAPAVRYGPDAIVLEALQRDPVKLARATEGALGWCLAAHRAWREGLQISAASILEESAALCRNHNLNHAEEVEAWLARHHVSRDRLDQILESSALASHTRGAFGVGLETMLLDYLRWTGDYSVLLARSQESP